MNVNLNAPKSAVRSVTSETSGDAPGLNLGLNMAGALGDEPTHLAVPRRAPPTEIA